MGMHNDVLEGSDILVCNVEIVELTLVPLNREEQTRRFSGTH